MRIRHKKLSEESDRKLLIDSNIGIVPSYKEMIFTTWMAGWFYLDIYRILWWTFIIIMILGFIHGVRKGTYPLFYYALKELKKRGYK